VYIDKDILFSFWLLSKLYLTFYHISFFFGKTSYNHNHSSGPFFIPYYNTVQNNIEEGPQQEKEADFPQFQASNIASCKKFQDLTYKVHFNGHLGKKGGEGVDDKIFIL
jgi:hypothetical protein